MVMPNKETEKTIGASIDLGLAEEFASQVFGRNFKMKTLFAAFAKWWIGLSEEEQKRFYLKAGDENLETFSEWVERLINEKLKIKAGKTPKITLQESAENVIYFTKYKLPSLEERQILNNLFEALKAELYPKKKKRKKA